MAKRSLDTIFEVDSNNVFDGTDFESDREFIPEEIEGQEERLPIVYDEFKNAQENLKRLVMKGEAALDDLMSIAKSAESPRGYEVVSDLLRTLNDMNAGIIDREREEETERQGNITNNNTLIVGNMDDVLDLIRSKQRGSTKEKIVNSIED